MSLLTRARKNISLKLVSEALIRLLALAFIVLVARGLGDQEYGKYSIMFYWGGLLTIISDLGLNTLMIREVSRRPALLPSYAGNILSLRLLFSSASLALTALLLPFLGYSGDLSLLVVLGVFILLGNHLVEFLAAVTNSLERFETELLIKSLNKGLTVLAGLGALALGTGLWGLVLALAAAHLGSLLLNGGIIWKRITPLVPQRDRFLWKQLLRSTLPIGLSLFFMTAYVRLDIILLSLLRGDTAEIGWYSVPVKIVEGLSLFPYLIMAGLFPIFSSLTPGQADTLRGAYHKSLGYLVMISLPLVLLLSHLADPGLVIVFGSGYGHSVASLRIILWAVPFIFAHFVMLHVLFALNRERLIILGSGLALLFNLVSNLILLPPYGYLGASVTTVATEVLLVLFYLAQLQRSPYRLALWPGLAGLILSGGLLALTLRVTPALSAGLRVAAALLVYLGALIILGLLTREDWTMVKRMVGRRSSPESVR